MNLRSGEYLRLLVGAALISIPVGLATLAFVEAYKGLEDVLWESVPDAFDVDPHGWWPLIPTTLGGIAVGLLIRSVPGRGGPSPADGHGAGDEGAEGLKAVPGLLVIAIISLAAGASLGPEMPLITAVATIGALGAVSMRLPKELLPGLVLAAVAAVFGGILASPLLGAILLLELPTRPPSEDRDRYVLILPAIVGSTVGYLIFLGLAGEPFASYELPVLSEIHVADVTWALGIGLAGGLLGLAFIRFFRLIDPLVARVADRPVALATAGGLLIGLIAIVVGSRTLFSGEHELQEVIDASEPLGVLLALAAGKALALLVCLVTGFRGGRIFPLLFIGGVLGLALAEVTSVPTGLSVPCGMLSVAIPAMRLPLVLIVVVAFFTSAAVLPLLVLSGVVSYLVCHDQPELRDPPAPAEA